MNRTQPSYRERTAIPKPEPIGVELSDMAASYTRYCDARNLSGETVAIYRAELGKLDRFLHAQGMPTDCGLIRREHIESWLVSLQERFKPASVSVELPQLSDVFRWLVDEDELLVSPMARMKAPIVPQDPPAVISQTQMRAMLDACKGTDFDSRRDLALITLLADTGIRRGELVNLNLGDVNLALGTISVKGKARVPRFVGIGVTTVAAMDRYLRVRGRHPHASSDAFFIGRFGRLGPSGVLTLVKRRGKLAGITALHPHIFRHTWAHEMLSDGTAEGEVAALGGWKDRSMLDRYGAVARQERAIESHRRHSPMDRLARK